MRINDLKQFTRRGFLGCFSGLAAALALKGAVGSTLDKPPQKGLYDPLNPEEEKIINSSKMAKEIVTLEGYNCAESILLAALKYLKKPEEFLHSAAAFGGGMGHYDLCGLLTGGFMALGIAAGTHHQDRKEMKSQAKKMTKEYWNWWESWAPLHCYQLKPKYDKDVYINMKKRVAAKIEELIKKGVGDPNPLKEANSTANTWN
ncbi:MAG: C_GCAxxG_C_C family protein [Candidatus Aminicenantes bacterium]|nr:MAG: C_GCAxxG_C_C family protein [Candidatus Aminicenantes bacterium]